VGTALGAKVIVLILREEFLVELLTEEPKFLNL